LLVQLIDEHKAGEFKWVKVEEKDHHKNERPRSLRRRNPRRKASSMIPGATPGYGTSVP
jgi:hypothetical protein